MPWGLVLIPSSVQSLRSFYLTFLASLAALCRLNLYVVVPFTHEVDRELSLHQNPMLLLTRADQFIPPIGAFHCGQLQRNPIIYYL